jgi:carboxylesterase type B
MSNAGSASNVWNYRFNQPSILTTAAGLGVPHNIDLGAMFGSNVSPYNGVASTLSNIVSFGSFGVGGENQAVVPLMMDYIISFVTTLNPNTMKASQAGTWQPFESAGVEQRVVIQDSGTTMETIPNDFKSRCQFWEDLIPVTGQ